LTEHLKQYSLSLTVIYIVMNIVNFAIYSKTTNYMTNAYMALVPVALLYGSSFSNRQTFRFLVSVFASILIVVSGSRGAALCMIGFIGMYHIISRKLTLKKLVLVLVIIISAVVVILNIGNILVFLSEVFRKMGVSTRLIDLINGKETGIFQLSGRDKVYPLSSAANKMRIAKPTSDH
jgi:O-antigen ligase